jgi:hypothetical protein
MIVGCPKFGFVTYGNRATAVNDPIAYVTTDPFEPTPPTMEMYNWEIVLVRPRGRVIGTVGAPDRETAIKSAIEEFKITDPTLKGRLTAQRLSN